MSDPRTLYLVLKHEWFVMIDEGDKREEYREIKPYWTKRLEHRDLFFDRLCFIDGYKRNAKRRTFTVTEFSKDYGQIRWGAALDKKYYVIKFS